MQEYAFENVGQLASICLGLNVLNYLQIFDYMGPEQ